MSYNWEKLAGEFNKHERDVLGVLSINDQMFFSVDGVCNMTPLWDLQTCQMLARLESSGWVTFAHRCDTETLITDPSKVYVALSQRVAYKQAMNRLKLRQHTPKQTAFGF
jgi:hypothetical protein